MQAAYQNKHFKMSTEKISLTRSITLGRRLNIRLSLLTSVLMNSKLSITNLYLRYFLVLMFILCLTSTFCVL